MHADNDGAPALRPVTAGDDFVDSTHFEGFNI